MKNFFLFAAIFAIFIATSAPAGAQTTMTATVDDNQRQAIVFRRLPQSAIAGGYEYA